MCDNTCMCPLYMLAVSDSGCNMFLSGRPLSIPPLWSCFDVGWQ